MLATSGSFYKIALVGDGGVGKTTFVKRHLGGEIGKKYVATLGVEVHPMDFVLRKIKNDENVENDGDETLRLNVWDLAGGERFGGVRDGYFRLTSGAIVMFDSTDRMSFKNVRRWIQDLRRTTLNIPIAIVMNKDDLASFRISPIYVARLVQKANHFNIKLAECRKAAWLTMMCLHCTGLVHRNIVSLIGKTIFASHEQSCWLPSNVAANPIRFFVASAACNYNFHPIVNWLAQSLTQATIEDSLLLREPNRAMSDMQALHRWESEFERLVSVVLPLDDL